MVTDCTVASKLCQVQTEHEVGWWHKRVGEQIENIAGNGDRNQDVKDSLTDDRQGTSHWLPQSQILVLIIGLIVLRIHYTFNKVKLDKDEYSISTLSKETKQYVFMKKLSKVHNSRTTWIHRKYIIHIYSS